jgi:CheY-like chemotaxis protein
MHGLRTPVNSIVGLTVLARRSDNIDDIKEYLGRIEEASYQLINTVNNLTDIYQMEEENLLLESNEFDLEDLIDSVLDMVFVKAEARDITIFLDLKNVFRQKVTADRFKLAKAMFNILSNAIDFCARGGKVILRAHLKSERELFISINSDGKGLTTEKVEAMFGISTGSEITALPVCRRLVEIMGGELKYDVDIERGIVFWFTAKVHSQKKGANELVRTLRGLKPKILLVDDRPEVAEYFYSVASEADCEVTAADTLAATARFLLHKREFDAVFINFEMLTADFFSIMQNIKKHVAEKRIVLMVKNSRRQIAQKFTDIGGLHGLKFITVPILPTRLLEQTADILGLGLTAARHLMDAPDLTGRRILIVDDHDLSREITAGILEPTHAEIFMAENGKEAVEMYTINPNKYDVVLMDVQMPVMDGLTATRTIRAAGTPTAATLPIIAVTANIFDLDKKSCYDAGMSRYISKPISVRELYRVLSDVLIGGRGCVGGEEER